MGKAERRVNRRHVLEALNRETGSWGGDKAEARVRAYCADPLGASTTEFGYVGGLRLVRFYIDDSKPNNSERASLWLEASKRMERLGIKDPGGWDGKSDAKKLQAILEEA